ncbi:hypothetical protein AGMMS50284_6870 [Clostridia bacterium]|nr:hypothetical protein AGMMS50284_6870 [Clostridia bacterium]
MKNYQANNWQELSLRKELQDIKKVLVKNERKYWAIIFEIGLIFVTIILDRYFEIFPNKEDQKHYLTFLAVIIGITVVIWFISTIIPAIAKLQNSVVNPSINEMINSFDDKICYYAMMSTSFFDLYNAADETKEKNQKIFYLIEMCYYRNKIIKILYDMRKSLKNVFETDENFVISSRKISIGRLENIILLLNSITDSIDKEKNHIESLNEKKSILTVNEEYNKDFQKFKNSVKEELGKEIG